MSRFINLCRFSWQNFHWQSTSLFSKRSTGGLKFVALIYISRRGSTCPAVSELFGVSSDEQIAGDFISPALRPLSSASSVLLSTSGHMFKTLSL